VANQQCLSSEGNCMWNKRSNFYCWSYDTILNIYSVSLIYCTDLETENNNEKTKNKRKVNSERFWRHQWHTERLHSICNIFLANDDQLIPSVLWCCWLGGRKGIRPVKNWVVGCWRGYLGWGADLHMVKQMPLPLTIYCSSKSRLVLPSWFLPFTGWSRTDSRRAVKRLYVYVVNDDQLMMTYDLDGLDMVNVKKHLIDQTLHNDGCGIT